MSYVNDRKVVEGLQGQRIVKVVLDDEMNCADVTTENGDVFVVHQSNWEGVSSGDKETSEDMKNKKYVAEKESELHDVCSRLRAVKVAIQEIEVEYENIPDAALRKLIEAVEGF